MPHPAPSPLISVIVPVYNVEDYVADCLRSLQQQSFDQIEVIVVIDGATDNSATRARQAVTGDPRFVFVEQANQGLSGARNTGLAQARGEFIAFVDSDDRVMPNYLQTLHDALHSHSADWVACGVRFCNADGSTHLHSAIHDAADPSLHRVPHRYPFDSWSDVIRHFPSAWNKLYRRDLIGDLRFDENTWFEDHSFFQRLAARTDHLVHIPDALYLQTQGRDGQITGQDTDRIFEQFDVLDTLRETLNNQHSGADTAFAHIATRLIYERSTTLRNPDRRARFARESAAFLARHTITYDPASTQDPDITHSWALEMAGQLPLSVIVPWDGKTTAALSDSLTALTQAKGPGFEVIILCPSARAAQAAQNAVPHHGLRLKTLTTARPTTPKGIAAGVAQATGQFVTVLHPGDAPHPWAYLRWVDHMLTSGADAVLSQFTAQDRVHHGVHTPYGSPPDTTAQATLISPENLATQIDAPVSAMAFNRAALLRWDILDGTGTRPDITVPFCTALRAKHIAYNDWPAVHIASQDRRYTARPRQLWRDHTTSIAQIKSTLTPQQLAALPHGWERRLYARQFGHRLALGAQSVPQKARLAAGAAIGAARLGFSDPALNSALLDPSVGPKQALILNAPLVARTLWRKATGRTAALPDFSGAMRHAQRHYAFPAQACAAYRFKTTFHTDDYANLSFHGPDVVSIPFHLSLRHAENCVVWNDTDINGLWRHERRADYPLARGGDDVLILFENGNVTVSINDTVVFNIRLASTRGARRNTIASLTHQGGVRTTEILPQIPNAHSSDAGVFLDARLQLIAPGQHTGPQMAEIADDTGQVLQTVALHRVAQGRAGRGVLPGRIWQKLPAQSALRVVAGSNAADEPHPTVPAASITREDVAARITDLLRGQMSFADAALRAVVVEHLVHGAVMPLLPADVQPKALTLVKDMGQTLPEDTQTPPLAAPPRPTAADIQFQSALAQFTRSQHQTPRPDPIEILRNLTLDPQPQRILFLTLSEVFCQTDDQVAPFVDLARDLNVPVFELRGETDPWTRSALLPFLCLSGQYDAVLHILHDLASVTRGWVLTPPVAWALRHCLDSADLSPQMQKDITEAFKAFILGQVYTYWGRAPCHELTKSVTYLAHTDPDENGAFCVKTYGLQPEFWATLRVQNPDLSRLSDRLKTAFDHFCCLYPHPSSDADKLAEALAYFIRCETAGAAQWARENGRPDLADILTDVPSNPDSTAIRTAALPGAPAPADPARVARDIARLDTTRPDLDRRATPPDRSDPPRFENSTFGPVDPDLNTLVVVFSCRPNLDTRIPALRDAWLSQLSALGVPYIVVVGDGTGHRDGDVVHLDAPDDYEGLPQKTLAAIAWVHDNTSFDHLYKIDDDCFLNAPLFFRDRTYQSFDYYGRMLWRNPGQMDRSWHQEKSRSDRGKYELDKSLEPSTYADGGSGYTLSRAAMAAALHTAQSPEGQAIIDASFMEDKMLGDLLALAGISVRDDDYHVSVRRRSHPDAIAVPKWHNNFHPNESAPIHLVHLDTHLDQTALRDGLTDTRLWPRKIWPGYQRVRLGPQTNALELISSQESVAAAQKAEVAVVACMRNEMFMLPHFLDHYRALGVTAFLIADNVSDDGTLEYLADQPDVALFSVDTDYRTSHYGVAWQQALLAAFRQDKWSVVADADELLVWQTTQTQTLPELLAEPDFAQADAARLFMLDMYPKGSLSDATFETGTPFEQAGFVDRIPFLTDSPMRGPFSDQPAWTSALRHRLIPGSTPNLFVAQKQALLRYRPWMRLSEGLHFVANTTLAPRELVFAHFKYNAAFRAKAQAEVDRGQHFNDAEEYRKYLALTSEGRDIIYDKDLSVLWHDSPFVRRILDQGSS